MLEYFPAAQSLQLVRSVAATVVEYLPVGQIVHALLPFAVVTT